METDISVTFRHSSEAGGFATVLIAVTWLTGYSLDVIRHVYDGKRFLPAIRFSRNLKNGIVLLCSRVIWGIIALLSIQTFRSHISELAPEEWIFNLAVIVMFVGLALEYQIAMARFALEDRPGRAFEIWTNVAILVRNPRKSMALAFSLAGLGLLYMLPLKAIYEALPWRKLWQLDECGRCRSFYRLRIRAVLPNPAFFQLVPGRAARSSLVNKAHSLTALFVDGLSRLMVARRAG